MEELKLPVIVDFASGKDSLSYIKDGIWWCSGEIFNLSHMCDLLLCELSRLFLQMKHDKETGMEL